ncbi:hypothetical protein BGZ96_012616 [Linnemannia gamsii]|uniref:Copper transport protein n=1 Tax=Linnemannia gamsii TaxID=64522 RepID=A0ABQ7JQY7_9FUNG|nr:hypothetical protein BGZ96_012616 [Linnemannia gamsii]
MDHSMASGFKPGLGSAVWSPDLTPMSEPQYIGALIGLFILSVGFRALVAAQGYLEAYLHLHVYPRPSYSSSSHSRHNLHLHQQQQQLLNPGQVDDDDNDDEDVQNLALDGSNGNNSNGNHTGVGSFAGLALSEKSKNDPSLLPFPQQEHQGQGVHQQSGIPSTPSSRPKRYGGRRHHSPPPFYAATTANSGLPFLTFPTAQPFIWQAEVARAVLTTAVIGIGYMLMLVIMTYNSAYLGVILAGVFVGEVYFARWGRVRPIFTSTKAVSKTRTSRLNEMKQQSAQSTDGATAVARTAAMSRNSLASTTSSHGYSNAMAHHGDGSC